MKVDGIKRIKFISFTTAEKSIFSEAFIAWRMDRYVAWISQSLTQYVVVNQTSKCASAATPSGHYFWQVGFHLLLLHSLSLSLFRSQFCCVVRNGIAWRTNRQWLQQTVMTTNECVCRCVHKRDDHTNAERNVKCWNSMREFSVWMIVVPKPYAWMRPVVFRKWRPVNRVLCACVKWKH